MCFHQRNAGAKLLAAELYGSLRERGRTVWLDVKMGKLNTAAMQEAAQVLPLTLTILVAQTLSFFHWVTVRSQIPLCRRIRVATRPFSLQCRRRLKSEAGGYSAQNVKCIVAVVSGAEREGDSEDSAYFKREYCVNELRWARSTGVPIQVRTHYKHTCTPACMITGMI